MISTRCSPSVSEAGASALRGLAATGLVVVLSVVALTGCGSDDEPSEVSVPSITSPQATAKDAPPPPTDIPTEPAAPSTTAPTTPADAEPIFAPAQFRLRGGRLTPPTITVPAFIAVEVSVANADARAHVLAVRTDRAYTLRVGPRRRAILRVAGRRAGRAPVTVDGRPAGALEFGGEPGP